MEEELAALAREAGFNLESWATNPPKPAQWHGTPEALEAFARAVLRAAPCLPLEPTQAMLEAASPFPSHLSAEHPDPADPWHATMKAATKADQMAVASLYRAMVAAHVAGVQSPLICWGLSSFCAEAGRKCRDAGVCVYAPTSPTPTSEGVSR